jgi:hypothetical protein
MSHRLLELQEERRNAAISIALAGGSLKRCPLCEEELIDAGLFEHSYAYRVGNAKLKSGELGDLFASPRDMTDAVKDAINEFAGGDRCTRCDNMLKD